jgi:hypothetical protein
MRNVKKDRQLSGLETAIRNALDRSNRADRDIRARIYQSARQALDAGLQKQGVSDRLMIMQQRELLEQKIHEIEMEEVRRLSEEHEAEAFVANPASVTPVSVDPPVGARSEPPLQAPAVAPDDGLRRVADAPAVAAPQEKAEDRSSGFADFGATPEERIDAPLPTEEVVAKGRKSKKPARKGRGASDTMLDVPAERAAKPRRRRSFLSHLMTWVITLAVVGAACFWFYQSGMVQSIIDEAVKAADEAGSNRAVQGSTAFDPRRGFSDEWVEIFKPSASAQLKPGAQARVETLDGSEGQAVRLTSAVPGEGGDVAFEVPVEVLQEMAGKTSTIALSLQSGEDRSTQLSVRCEFGSLGRCSRHRFTATQERLDALFKVTFERSLAPNQPGRLIVNTGIDGADRPVLIYSVRILPGQ